MTTTKDTMDTMSGRGSYPLSCRVIGCALGVHRVVGLGFLESMSELCLARGAHARARSSFLPLTVAIARPRGASGRSQR